MSSRVLHTCWIKFKIKYVMDKALEQKSWILVSALSSVKYVTLSKSLYRPLLIGAGLCHT